MSLTLCSFEKRLSFLKPFLLNVWRVFLMFLCHWSVCSTFSHACLRLSIYWLAGDFRLFETKTRFRRYSWFRNVVLTNDRMSFVQPKFKCITITSGSALVFSGLGVVVNRSLFFNFKVCNRMEGQSFFYYHQTLLCPSSSLSSSSSYCIAFVIFKWKFFSSNRCCCRKTYGLPLPVPGSLQQ